MRSQYRGKSRQFVLRFALGTKCREKRSHAGSREPALHYSRHYRGGSDFVQINATKQRFQVGFND
ncbi:MAG: hypothetical protein AMXMBFR7_42370 [Planctomycetota bacterium]